MPPRARAVTAAYAATIFLSALLLFWMELMIGKRLLPVWGGAPAVWVTCMVFFQAALLAGYAWAHAGVALLGVRRHAATHLALAAASLLLLPIAIDGRAEWLRDLPPVAALLALLAVSIGPHFFVLSTTSPLLQRWFAEARAGERSDPYALYVASNLGSLAALAAYPAVLEPAAGLARQSSLWSGGYALLGACLLACAAALPWRRAGADAAGGGVPAGEAPSLARRLRWLALAAIPSSHMLGVTAYLTTDIAPVPLLWVLPLGLYLLTFVLVFSASNPVPHRVSVRALPFFAAVSALLVLGEANRPLWLIVPAHLACFFFGAMVCHGALAAGRPAAGRLTGFYLWLSAGGVAGGLFNAIAAPLLFAGLAEYPLAIVAGCLARHDLTSDLRRDHGRDLAWAGGIGLATLALVLGWRALGRAPDRFSVGLLFCLPILFAYRNLRFPVRFALALGAIFAAGSLYTGAHGEPLVAGRSFFGTLRVTKDLDGFHRLVHGGTVHGRQNRDPALAREPIDYYARTGPVGQVFDLVAGSTTSASIAVVGLGAGEVAAYARAAEAWTFYEIDPLVAAIATDERLFTYLRDGFPDPSRRAIRLGDARLELESAPDAGYELIVLDAFSSDAIPTHLVTREALSLYLAKLAPSGILAFHVSNNFVELEPVLGNLARDAGLAALAREDAVITAAEWKLGKTPSRWVAMSRDPARLAPLIDRDWSAAPVRESLGVWTDDHSNLLRVLRVLR